MASNGHWPDLLDLWLDFTSAVQSPQQFKLWSGISLIGAALERRVWAQTKHYTTYPNLYIMLVAAPGIGKQVIEEARDIWTAVKKPNSPKTAFKINSDSITRASLIDELVSAKETFVTPAGPPLIYHSLMLIAEEIQVMMPAYERDFVSRLNSLYNGKSQHSESRRTGTVREVKIELPLLNMLVGAQPAYLASTFPEDSWNTGIARRLIMVYSAEGSLESIFDAGDTDESLGIEFTARLSQLSALFGQMQWEPEAAELARDFDYDWHQRLGGRDGLTSIPAAWSIPNHSKLVHYNRSRTMFLIKLSTVAAVAARCELVIRRCDVERALTWILAAEVLMPDIFREMRGKSDREVIEELHRFAIAMWTKDRQKPITGGLLIDFLSHRLPSEKVEKVLILAERANIIAKVAGTADLYIPRPNYNSGME